MRKAANGEGTVRSKPRADGRWEGRYFIQVAGVWKRRSVFGRTKAEAAKKLREALTARDAGANPVPAKETMATFLDAWLKGAQSSLKPRTFVSYTQIVRDHLKPGLGRIPLARLQPQQIQSLYAELLDGRSPKTVRNVHVALHRALQQALRWRLIPTNVADLVDPPRVIRREMQALNPEQARQVLEAARSDDLEALWMIAITAGLRQGELLALKWPEVDFEHGTLRVIASLIRLAGQEPQLAEPKSRRSRRQVELSTAAIDSLRRHRTAAIEGALHAGRSYDRNGFVFSRPDGRPLSATTTWKCWRRLLLRAGAPVMPFHSARHTAATLCLAAGVHPKKVSEMLGHATISITLDTYSHVIPTMHRDAARVMDELFST
jgi:integrase